MAKTGPLGKAEAFYVEEKYKIGMLIQDIAKELDRAEGAIEKYLKKNKLINSKPTSTIIEQQFAKQSGATIMTENASTMIDASRKKVLNSQKNCITKIK